MKDGFAKIVRYGDIKNKLPRHLKISPVACIPHKSRSYQVILDLSFNLRVNGIKLASVNDSTNKLAPSQAMAQIGSVLKRLVAAVADS